MQSLTNALLSRINNLAFRLKPIWTSFITIIYVLIFSITNSSIDDKVKLALYPSINLPIIKKYKNYYNFWSL